MNWTCSVCGALAAPGNANLPDGKTIVHRGECEAKYLATLPQKGWRS